MKTFDVGEKTWQTKAERTRSINLFSVSPKICSYFYKNVISFNLFNSFHRPIFVLISSINSFLFNTDIREQICFYFDYIFQFTW